MVVSLYAEHLVGLLETRFWQQKYSIHLLASQQSSWPEAALPPAKTSQQSTGRGVPLQPWIDERDGSLSMQNSFKEWDNSNLATAKTSLYSMLSFAA